MRARLVMLTRRGMLTVLVRVFVPVVMMGQHSPVTVRAVPVTIVIGKDVDGSGLVPAQLNHISGRKSQRSGDKGEQEPFHRKERQQRNAEAEGQECTDCVENRSVTGCVQRSWTQRFPRKA